MFTSPTTPNITDFLTFLANSVQIPATALPANSPYPQYALDGAVALVLQPVPNPLPIGYVLACYYGATHLLLMIAPDQQGQTYFADKRSKSGFNLVNPSSGLVTSTSDNGTSASVTAPEWVSGLTVGQLGFYKTPWGREYLSWQQSYGPTIVGLT